jgi:hypothetical protein
VRGGQRPVARWGALGSGVAGAQQARSRLRLGGTDSTTPTPDHTVAAWQPLGPSGEGRR